jgi:hypothetical protein
MKTIVLREMHNLSYVGHPGYQRTIATVRSQYFWPGMNKEVANYISKCLECQKMKTNHRHPTGIVQQLSIPKWKWEVVKIDFMLPRTMKQYDSIMVVVDKLTKETHFTTVNTTHKETNIA